MDDLERTGGVALHVTIDRSHLLVCQVRDWYVEPSKLLHPW
jgi:hypothetical protein